MSPQYYRIGSASIILIFRVTVLIKIQVVEVLRQDNEFCTLARVSLVKPSANKNGSSPQEFWSPRLTKEMYIGIN
jgi:hypothetical protein